MLDCRKPPDERSRKGKPPIRPRNGRGADAYSIERSRIMRAVKSRDTGPERIVRRIVTRLGYRYRLHRADLPGKPDLTISARRSVIFVHGCFWHGHRCRRGARMPKTNILYWSQKISRNRSRDASARRHLRNLGWKVLVIWECQLKDEAKSIPFIRNFLDPASKAHS
jgi:DNA mismatch endonuclease (patch repair protein)